jgi:hypothetical protein
MNQFAALENRKSPDHAMARAVTYDEWGVTRKKQSSLAERRAGPRTKIANHPSPIPQ